MRFHNYLFFIKKRMRANKKINIVGILISIICFFVFYFSISFPWLYHKAYDDVDRLLPTGLKQSAVLMLEREFAGNQADNELILELLNLDSVAGIASCGSFLVTPEFYYDDTSLKEKFIAISRAGRHNFFDEKIVTMSEPGIECTAISSATIGYYDIDLYKGSLEAVSGDETIIYLGYNYKDIPIGTVLWSSDTEGNIVEQRVAGILEKGSEIIDSHSCASNYGLKVDYSINLDNMMLSVWKYDDRTPIRFSNGILISFALDTDYDQGMKEVTQIGDKYGVIINAASLEGKIRNELSSYDIILQLLSSISPLLFVVMVIIMLCIQLMTTLLRKNELGVWLANGFERRMVLKLLIFEVGIKLLFSSLISGLLFDLYLKHQVVFSESTERSKFFDLYLFAPSCGAVVVVIASVLMGISSYKFICRKKMPEIINDSRW